MTDHHKEEMKSKQQRHKIINTTSHAVSNIMPQCENFLLHQQLWNVFQVSVQYLFTYSKLSSLFFFMALQLIFSLNVLQPKPSLSDFNCISLNGCYNTHADLACALKLESPSLIVLKTKSRINLN